MKLYINLAFATAGLTAIAAFAGCTGLPGTTPTPTPTVAATPAPRLVFSKLAFSTGGTGYHAVVLSNKSGAAVDLSGYRLYYFPTTTTAEASASFVGSAGTAPTIANNDTLLVWLRSDNATVSTTAARVDWTTGGVVQAGAGELALFKSTTSTASTDLLDYVKWGAPSSTHFEPLAVTAGLWTSGTTAAASITPPATLSVKTETATGSTNWQ